MCIRDRIPFDIDEWNEQNEFDQIVEDGVTGQAIASYGIRICYMPNEQIAAKHFDGMDVPASLKFNEKAYEVPALPAAGTGSKHYIPLMKFEVDLIDETITDFLDDEITENELDFACLVEGLTTSPQYKLLFNNVISTSAIGDILMAHVSVSYTHLTLPTTPYV